MTIKGKIEETFRSKNLTSIPPAQQRVIFCGQILTPETLKVKEIQNIADGTVSFSDLSRISTISDFEAVTLEKNNETFLKMFAPSGKSGSY